MESCAKCKAEFSWEGIQYDDNRVKGYRFKEHVCNCGHKTWAYLPSSTEEKSFWNKIKVAAVGENH